MVISDSQGALSPLLPSQSMVSPFPNSLSASLFHLLSPSYSLTLHVCVFPHSLSLHLQQHLPPPPLSLSASRHSLSLVTIIIIHSIPSQTHFRLLHTNYSLSPSLFVSLSVCFIRRCYMTIGHSCIHTLRWILFSL